MRSHRCCFSICIVWLAAAACGRPPATRVQAETKSIAPLAAAGAEGTLVVAVLGAPREIEYTLNGVRIQPDSVLRWWEDARLTLQLAPGTYALAATYRVRGFAGGKDRARLETRSPVLVEAGATTHLLAEIERDWRGVPARDPGFFGVVDAATFASRTRPASAATAAAAASAAPPPAATAAPVPDIVIRGDDVLPAGETGLPPAAAPVPEDLPPAPAAPVSIAVQLRSEPDGARVFVDDHDMGSTPLRLQLDPAADHVLRFEREGCSDHVRFLAAASWREGRSSTITVQLDCP